MISVQRRKKETTLYFTQTKDITALKFYIFNVETYIRHRRMSLSVTGRLNNTRLQISIFLERDRRRLTAGSYKSFRVDYERFVHNAYPPLGHVPTCIRNIYSTISVMCLSVTC